MIKSIPIKLSERGGVLGAMDTMYQRSKTQEESMGYDVFDQIRKKHDGSLPLVGVNAFLPKVGRRIATEIELIRREKCTWPHFCSNGRAFGTPLISRVRRRVHLY